MSVDRKARGPMWVLFVIVVALGIYYASHAGTPPEGEETERFAHHVSTP
ncbi:hypothetical protein [Anaeromyxobacter terrae]|nr:hypothetical protein [Anaeromyxobacter sp. SG22]